MNHPNATQSAAIGKAMGTRSSVLDMLVDERRKLIAQLDAVSAAIEAIKALEDMGAPGKRAIADGTTDGSAVRTASGRRPKFGMADDILRCLRESQEDENGVGVQWIATWLAKNTFWQNGTSDVAWQKMVAQHLTRLVRHKMIKRVRRGYYRVLRRSPGSK